MAEHLVAIFSGMGLMGLLLAVALEGSSLPFPGVIVVLAYGYLLNPDLKHLLWIALLMSAVYSLASFLPFGIGWKLNQKAEQILGDRVNAAKSWFRRYGGISVALTRPFSIGNYISYVAGISKLNPWKYVLLTFLGIFPWSFTVMYLGRMYNSTAVRALVPFHEHIFVAVLVVLGMLYVFAAAGGRVTLKGAKKDG